VAHNIVGKTVAKAVADRLPADEVTHAMLDQTSQDLFDRSLGVSAEAIRQALDPAENIRRRTVQGGTAPEELGRMIKDRKDRLMDDRARLDADLARIAASRVDVLREARAAVGQAD
jgi:argininosuccinate lyase